MEFCQKEIKASTVISDYLGKVINITEYDLDNDKRTLFDVFY